MEIHPALSVYFRLVRPKEDIIDAHIVKIRKAQKRFRRRDALAVFKFGQKRLLDPGLHLYGYLRITAAFPQLPEPVFHHDHLMTLCHIRP